MNKSAIASKSFSYHDVVMYQSDIDRFSDKQWLNDQCINLCFRKFEHEDFIESATFILFLDPSIVSCIRLQCDEESEYREIYEGLLLSQKKLIFIPVNDNSSFDSGSCHWSLLVHEQGSRAVLHLDSSNNYNSRAAIDTSASIYKLLSM